MIYNISAPNTTLESIQAITPYTFTFDGLIVIIQYCNYPDTDSSYLCKKNDLIFYYVYNNYT